MSFIINDDDDDGDGDGGGGDGDDDDDRTDFDKGYALLCPLFYDEYNGLDLFCGSFLPSDSFWSSFCCAR